MRIISLASIALFFCAITSVAVAQGTSAADPSPSRLRGVIERFEQDLGALNRWYSAPLSLNRADRVSRLYADELAALSKWNFEGLSHDEQIDYILFKNYLEHEQKELVRNRRQVDEIGPIVPFARTISDLEDARRRMEAIDPTKAGAALNDLAKQISETQRSIDANAGKPKRTVAYRAARAVASLRNTLKNWYNFYNGYDPMFSWWNAEPYKTADDALAKYGTYISEKLVGIKADDRTTIVGDPIGREALLEELKFEMVPYTPEELVEIANKEFAWCEAEMKMASRELGYGDDWKKALEAVKQKYVEPGKQPELIKRLAFEAVDFVEKNNLVTVPPMAKETWRMEMMTPERQLVAPFFLGGETILVSYPTSGMTHEQKMMSMRGNNPHFSHATVFHELIPGHHLQQFMNRRYRPYRDIFYTPFWTEGWALYWEFLLWDKGFQKTPEDKIGALFWRMHRCARIIFSLNFHLEKMTPLEAVDLLVDRVGHERDNALGEVRRSFSGDYGPLYQIAYMMGGLQFYRLHHDLVDGKKMTDREFHDRILHEGSIPVEMVRAILTDQKLTRSYQANWRFYDLSN
jgi:uncharacterized protein (DUF885 family)